MEIKKAEYKKEMVERNVCVSQAVYGCDECSTEIKEYPNETNRLEVTVFRNNESTEYLHFCSWKCVLSHLPKVESDYFVSLPYIYFDKKGIRSRDELIELLSPSK